MSQPKPVFIKEKTPSLLSVLRKQGARALSEMEMREIHRMLAIDHVIEGQVPSTISSDTVIYRGRDLLQEDREERAAMMSIVSRLEEEVSNMDNPPFQKATKEQFLAACSSWKIQPKPSKTDFKKVFGQSYSQFSGLDPENQRTLIFRHFRA